jgi:hypothetical protein
MKKLTDEEFIDQILRNNPGLTIEKAQRYLNEIGTELDLTGTKYDSEPDPPDTPAPKDRARTRATTGGTIRAGHRGETIGRPPHGEAGGAQPGRSSPTCTR